MQNRPLNALDRRRKPRRRGTARLFVLGAAFVASAAATNTAATRLHAAGPGVMRDAHPIDPDPPQRTDTRELTFAIQPAPLADVLAAFEMLTGIRVEG